jgi:hypothetical protein
MRTALIAVSCLPNPDDQVWQMLAMTMTRQKADPANDEIDQIIEKGED